VLALSACVRVFLWHLYDALFVSLADTFFSSKIAGRVPVSARRLRHSWRTAENPIFLVTGFTTHSCISGSSCINRKDNKEEGKS
jgi:hypothetical protein